MGVSRTACRQRKQAQDCVWSYGINQFEDLHALNRGAPFKPQARPQAAKVIRLDRLDFRR
jgi:hypothetical protein